MVKPLSSFSGYITYMSYALGEDKNGMGGFVVNDPFTLGAMSEARAEYTGEKIVETAAAGEFVPAWTPVVDNKVIALDADGVETECALAEGKATLPAGTVKVKYAYDNQIVPQDKLPTLVGHMEGIALTARARRIAIKYSQFAAFQSKQDYGVDLESTLAQQAQAELEYEIDGEAIYLIKNACEAAKEIKWVDKNVDTLAYSLRAESFARAIEQAKTLVYRATNKFMPTYMIISPEVMPILAFVPGFNASNNSIANGAYFAGTVNNLKVFVSPALSAEADDTVGVCYLGVLAADGVTATGIYAPYMPIVPTQLLGFADGTMEQGFSTLYDMKILNASLISKITIVKGEDSADVNVTKETV